MFSPGEYAAWIAEGRGGMVMSGFLKFMDGYRDEAACIAGLAQLRWPAGFVCAGCAGQTAYQLAARPRVFECAGCGRQHSVTAGTVFHRTRTPLRKWFAAAWLMAQDKRGVSALFLARELALRYDTAWLMAHKLRHALSERADYLLDGLIEIDESYYGGRGKSESRGRSLADPNKSLMAIAVKTVPASPRQGKGIKNSRFVAGSARIAVLPAASAAELGNFVHSAVKPGARIITDGLKSYDGLADSFRHYSIVQDGGKNADAVLPIVHVLFSNLKSWLNGTFHGVSKKHLPRYAREWNYRFNRRGRIPDLAGFVLRRAATHPTITYQQLVDGAHLIGAQLPALTG
jgi:transposase-like protein